MSKGIRQARSKLLPLANQFLEALVSYGRAELAGSLARGDSTAADIDIVFQPRNARLDVKNVLRRWGQVVKGGEKYIQVRHRSGVMIDVFVVRPPAKWDATLAQKIAPAPPA